MKQKFNLCVIRNIKAKLLYAKSILCGLSVPSVQVFLTKLSAFGSSKNSVNSIVCIIVSRLNDGISAGSKYLYDTE